MRENQKRLVTFGLIIAVLLEVTRGLFLFPFYPVKEANAGAWTKTIVWFMGQTTGAAVASAATTTFAFTINIPDIVSSTNAIRSAYIFYETVGSGVTITTSTFTIFQPGGTVQKLTSTPSLAQSVETTELGWRLEATTSTRNIIGNASGTYSLVFTANITGPTRAGENARLYLTYDYDPFAATQVNTVYNHIFSRAAQVTTTLVTSGAFNFSLPEASATTTAVKSGSSTNHFWAEFRGRVVAANDINYGWNSEATSSVTYTNTTVNHSFLILSQPTTASTSPSVSNTFKMRASTSTGASNPNAIGVATYTYDFNSTTKLRKTLQVHLMQSTLTTSTATINSTTTIDIPETSPSSTSAFLFGRSVFTTAANPGINAGFSGSACTSATAITEAAAAAETSGFSTLAWDVTANLQTSTSGQKTVCSIFTTSAAANIRGLMLFWNYDYARATTAGSRFNGNMSFLAGSNMTAGTTFSNSVNTTIANASATSKWSWLNYAYNQSAAGNAVGRASSTLGINGTNQDFASVGTGEATFAEIFSASSSAGFATNVTATMNCASLGFEDAVEPCITNASFDVWYQTDVLAASTTQIHYHWRNDDGGEATSTAAANEDISTTTRKGTTYRLRFEVSNEGDATSSLAARLEYQENATSGTWTAVATTSIASKHWRMATSSFESDGKATTNISTSTGGTTDENIYFLASEVVATTSRNQATSVELTGTQFAETEFAIRASSNAVGSSTYYFRVTDAGTALNNYAIYASTTFTSAAPTVSSVSLNNGSAIVLTPNATTSIRVNFTVTDTDGCADVFTDGSIQVTVNRTGAGATNSCTLNDLSCYRVSTSTNNCSGGNSASATSTVDIYYFAQATDASSSFASETWRAFVLATDSANATGSSSSTVELNTLLAIDVTPASIDYGTVNASSTSGSVNQTSTIKNAGNATTTLQISGKALTLGANLIATSSQRYATSTFTVGGSEQQLSGTATDLSGLSIPNPPMGMWQETQALPNVLSGMGAAAYNGYVYSVGGTIFTTPTTTVWYSAIAASGTLGSWTAATALTGAIKFMPAVAYSNYLYIIGGYPASGVTTSVSYAAVNTSTGALGSWSSATALPSGIGNNGGAAYNGYLYSTGGDDGLANTSTVRFALINATGSLGSWTNTTALPNPRNRHKTVVSGGSIYVLGGYSPTTAAATSSVAYAPLNADGTVGTWTITNALSTSTTRFGAAVVSSILYVVGGLAPTAATTTVIFAAQNASGSLGVWSQSPFSLPTAQYDQGLAADRGFVYQLGGEQTRTSTVIYSAIVESPLFWGITVPDGTATGTYTGQNTFTSVFSP